VAAAGAVGAVASRALGGPDLLDVTVRLRGLHPAMDGFRVAMLLDLHLGPLLGRSFTERIVRLVNDTEPDLFVIVGDLVDGEVHELAAATEPLHALRAARGTFFATGYHEFGRATCRERV